MPDQPPIQLNSFVAVQDLDPDAPLKMEAVFTLDWNAKASHFFGQSAPAGDRLELTLTPTASAHYWDAKLDVWDAFRFPETFHYSNIYVPVNRPWATPSFGDVHIQGRDFRVIQAKE